MTTKTETKQFQYEIQSYQEDCANNIISLFESLRQKANFGDVLTAHQKKNKYNFPVQDNKNIDIMMETGTGKTFTFIKTIFELSIVENDADMKEIEIFGKLPRLNIQTPLGKYNPDFCYAIKRNGGNKVFLVVEAKGYNLLTDIPEKEQFKIGFAKKYFEALGEHYKDQNIKVSLKERINKTQLAALIKA